MGCQPPYPTNYETTATHQEIRLPIRCCQGFWGYPGSGAAMGQGRESAGCPPLAVTSWQGCQAVRYGSVCSGIEAATVAWHPIGWEAAWYSEIEPFPCAVLKHHYPAVPNYGDMTKYEEWPDEPINLLVGGTPCQSFSVAGLRAGLADPRGNLMLTYGAIARRYRPKWLVWENVPGVLSSNGGRDFGTFLGMLAELGYGFAYRVLDAYYFGCAIKRPRLYVVGHFGNWRKSAAVLFERKSFQISNTGISGGPCGHVLSATNTGSRNARGNIINEGSYWRGMTPVETERAMGFPDNYTNIPWRKSSESPDGPRYKALGNSMAVPVMAWIGKRIQQVSEL